MIKIGISGIEGKMGKRVLSLAKQDVELEVVFGLEKKGHPSIGKTVQTVKVVDDPQIIEKCDCLIEFTTPSATVEHLPYLIKFKKCAVIGTTGLSKEEEEKVRKAAETVPIVFSPNMSVGVNLLFKLVEEAAKVLRDYSVYIEEAHHIHKKDAPSGTAKQIASILVENGFGIKTEDIKAIREDEIVGNHKVIFESELDRLELFHSAKTRDIFAKGALLAAKWVVGNSPGLYSMGNVLTITR